MAILVSNVELDMRLVERLSAKLDAALHAGRVMNEAAEQRIEPRTGHLPCKANMPCKANQVLIFALQGKTYFEAKNRRQRVSARRPYAFAFGITSFASVPSQPSISDA